MSPGTVDLRGQHVFITGGAGGIGLGMAHALADRGAVVTLADRDVPALQAAAAARPDVFALVELDVRDRAAWTRAKSEAQDRFGPVDILVNNAGIGPEGRSVADTTPESFDRIIAINVTGVFNGIDAFVRDMRDRGAGHIVNTASGGGFFIKAKKGPYAASKFAVVALSECLRDELAPFGVGVSILVPGATHSRLTETTRALGSAVTKDSPLPGSPEPKTSEEVGRRAVDGLIAGEFYIFTDTTTGTRHALLGRQTQILAEFEKQAAQEAGQRNDEQPARN